jgi:hypothetical protein
MATSSQQPRLVPYASADVPLHICKRPPHFLQKTPAFFTKDSRIFTKDPHQHQKAASTGKFFMLVGSLIKKIGKEEKGRRELQKHKMNTISSMTTISVVGRSITDVLKAPKLMLS